MMRRQDPRGEDADQASAEHCNKGHHEDEQAGAVDHPTPYRSRDEGSPRPTRTGMATFFVSSSGRRRAAAGAGCDAEYRWYHYTPTRMSYGDVYVVKGQIISLWFEDDGKNILKRPNGQLLIDGKFARP